MIAIPLIDGMQVFFDGATYDEQHDGARLRTQLERVRVVMAGGEWHTLAELARRVQGSEAGVSARLRDLRKPRFGGYRVQARRLTRGLWEYRLEVA